MVQSFQTQTDVLIVGAGPTGLTMACELQRRGISCRIIDRAAEPSQTSKALAVHSRTLELFEDLGIVRSAIARGVKVTGFNLYEEDKQQAHLDFRHLHAPYPYILSIPQRDTEALLLERLQSLGGTVERCKELTELRQDRDRAIALVRHLSQSEIVAQEEISASWLIGCDGASSQVRHALGMEFAGITYEERFWLADAELDWSLPRDRAFVWFHTDGPLAAIPLPQPRQWRLIANCPDRTSETLPEATIELFQQLLRERKGDRTTTLTQLVWGSQFKIHRRIVDRYRQGRIFLAGDAAHIHSPLGGQGMNLGIQDAYNLAWKLAIADRSSGDLLDTYEAERRPIAKAVLAGTDIPTKLLTSENPLLRFLRDRLLLQLLNWEFVQPILLENIGELNVNYRHSRLSQEHYRFGLNFLPDFKNRFNFLTAPKAGDRAPQGVALDAQSHTETSLFQAFQGTHFTLLLFTGISSTSAGCEGSVDIANAVESLLENRVRSLIVVVGDRQPDSLQWNGSILLDANRQLHQTYGAASESLYLIRPDGYIGFRSQPLEKQELLQYLKVIYPVN